MKPLSTNVGTNIKGNLWITMGTVGTVIGTFGTEWMKLTAFVAFCAMMAVINYRIKGSGIEPEEGDSIKESVDDMEILLKEARR